MNLRTKAAVAMSGLVLVAAPAAALAAKSPAPGDNASTPAASQYPKGHAYGFFCRSESKLHTAGVAGTPFSKCVTAMAKLASGSSSSPKAACATESKKHVAGKPGTPYSLCVSAAAKLLQTNP